MRLLKYLRINLAFYYFPLVNKSCFREFYSPFLKFRIISDMTFATQAINNYDIKNRLSDLIGTSNAYCSLNPKKL